jgi:hypothetical protein
MVLSKLLLFVMVGGWEEERSDTTCSATGLLMEGAKLRQVQHRWPLLAFELNS